VAESKAQKEPKEKVEQEPKEKKPKKEKAKEVQKKSVPRLKEKYRQKILPAIMKEFSFSNPMQVPRIEKILVNMGVGGAVADRKILDAAMDDLAIITGQRPKITKAKKSIAGFKIRTGFPVGCMVTLRGNRMYEFLDRLLSCALPRIRDFRGFSPRSFDGHGNYTFGVDEQLIFPEIDYDKVVKILGMDITFVTTAKDDDQGFALLKQFGFPFRR
jgi:large subunit ribosomal protein L5